MIYPHLDEPQSLQVRHPSWYIRFLELQESHFWPLASVPSATYLFNDLATPFFQVLIDSLSS
jgi:hypothetical protein